MDPCQDDRGCPDPPGEFVRLRYFFGQRLGVVDLADEQAYLAGKQRFHNRRAHGAGVLCGLRAELYRQPQGSAGPEPTTLLKVRRGAAIDACGREVVVGWDQCIDVAAWLARHPEALPPRGEGGRAPGSVRLWVALCYRECPSDPAPAPRDPCGCDDRGCEFARVREGFELRLLADADADTEAGPGAAGPGVAAQESLAGPFEAALARAFALAGGADCPDPPADPCLLLASVVAQLDPSGTRAVGLDRPDNGIAARRPLLPTSALQGLLVRAMAASAEAELVGAGPRLGAVGWEGSGPDSGTLSVEVLVAGAELSRDPFASDPPLGVRVSRFEDDGTWTPAEPTGSSTYAGPPDRAIRLRWDGGLAPGRYRLLIEDDAARPLADARMRPLAPPRWARHFRLEAGGPGGSLALADTLHD